MPSKEQIKAARKAADLTQAEAGRLVSKSLATWQRYEAGQKMDINIWERFLEKTKALRNKAKPLNV